MIPLGSEFFWECSGGNWRPLAEMTVYSTNDIPILSAADEEEVRKCIAKHLPVVIPDLYAGDFISRFRSPQSATKALGKLPIVINRDYYSCFRRRFDRYETTVGEYFRIVENDPGLQLLCTEQLAPREFVRELTLPGCVFGWRRAKPWVFLFLGNKHCFAPLHFDWDFRHVLLTQLLGRKRVVLLRPETAKRLLPVFNTASISLHGLSEDEKRHFVACNGGYDLTLQPGATIFIPKLWWHYTEYVDLGLSFNLRFGSFPAERVLATLPRNYHLQNLGLRLIGKEKGRILHQGHYLEVLTNFFAPAKSTTMRYQRMLTLYEKLYAEHCKEAPQGNYVGGNFDPERNLARRAIVSEYEGFWPMERADVKARANSRKADTLRHHFSGEEKRYHALLRYFGFRRAPPADLGELEATILLSALRTGRGLPLGQLLLADTRPLV